MKAVVRFLFDPHELADIRKGVSFLHILGEPDVDFDFPGSLVPWRPQQPTVAWYQALVDTLDGDAGMPEGRRAETVGLEEAEVRALARLLRGARAAWVALNPAVIAPRGSAIAAIDGALPLLGRVETVPVTKDEILEALDNLRAMVENMDAPAMTPPGAAVPMQPVIRSPNGVVHFRANAIVRWLVDARRVSLNEIVALPNISREDASQFWQMLGYSVDAYAELPFALGVEEADAAAAKLVRGEDSEEEEEP